MRENEKKFFLLLSNNYTIKFLTIILFISEKYILSFYFAFHRKLDMDMDRGKTHP